MQTSIRAYEPADLPAMVNIWNAVVTDGNAFPQTEPLTPETASPFFKGQSFTGVAVTGGMVNGLYILHPNNVGRCSHIANASYAVDTYARGRRIGESLVLHSLDKARELGFRILQFNAVVRSNERAIRLYEKLGFVRLGVIPGGFRLDNGQYEDIHSYYHLL